MFSSPRLGRNFTPIRLGIFALASATYLAILQLGFFSAKAVSTNIVISEYRVRGPQGGNDEFIELFNTSPNPVNVGGWKIKGSNNASAVSTRATIPNGLYLNGNCHYLLTNNASGGYSGAVAGNLTYSTGVTDDGGIAVTTSNDVIIDQVGMSAGSAFKEGTILASLGSTNLNRSYERKNGGAQDTDNNNGDFVIRTPSDPQNAPAQCLATGPTGTGSANPNPVPASTTTLLTVTVTAGTNPVSTGITVTGNLSSIGGLAAQTFYDDGTNGDVTAGDKIFSFSATVPGNISTGAKTIPITITDAQTRSSSPVIALSVATAPVPPGAVVISQVYGGGGNAGATLKNDYVELFNRSANVVDLNGWSVQYNSAADTTTAWQVTPLTGTIPPGGYYLVKEAQGAGGSQDLPAANDTGSIAMGAGAGKVALVNNVGPLTGCPTGVNIIDLVGYGSTAACSEGNNPTANTGNTLAAIRTHGGCKDTDNNGLDFKIGPPNPRNSSSSLHICPVGDLDPEVFSTTPGDGATSIPLTANITVQFDEPVDVAPNWFTISCASSGTHTATVTGGPTTFTLNPDTDFATLEQCTVTISASQVTDKDTIDPPDNMVADYSWSFLTGHDPQVHLTMGNPSNATPDAVNSQDNYLMEKEQYTISYNRSKATANWVSWQLDQTWLGSAPRQDNFRADVTLPLDWYHVLETDFQFSTYGFDRGHMCPSADRTATVDDNSATFLMTNMVPQASGNNQGPWGSLENYLRTIVAGGNRLYIISGVAGQGGVSTTGTWNTITTPTGGSITVPAFTWKVAIVVPAAGDNDVSKVNASTRTIAVIMPNKDNIRPDQWQKYLATVDQVEALTNYDFFSNVPTSIQAVIESRLDTADSNDTAPVAANKNASVSEDSSVQITLSATDFNVNNVLSFNPGNPAHGQLSNIGTPSCALIVSSDPNNPDPNAGKIKCTVDVTYTPNADYNGPDSFTFTANDAGLDSAPATVTINVTEENDAPKAADDSKTTSEDTPLVFAASSLTSNDSAGPANESGQTLTVALVSDTADTHGTVALNSGQITYTPSANYNGPASFTYRVCDDGTTNGLFDSKCDTATVSVTVDPVNDVPTANAQSVTLDEDTSKDITLAGSDIETPAEALSFQVTSGPAHGTLTGTAPNLTYVPAANYNGPDSFQFTVTDSGDGAAAASTSAPATVSITVNQVNDAPVLNSIGDKTVYLGTNLTFTASATDVDMPGQSLTYSLTGSVPSGAVIDSSTGAFSWTPTAAQVGQIYTFGVKVTDNGSPVLSAEEIIHVGVAYTWTGALQPINADGSSIFKLGRTVPVKFKLTGASTGLTNAVAKIYIAKVSDGVVGSDMEADSTSAASSGNTFRYDATADQYIFNLSTQGLTAGTYQIRVDMGDGVSRVITFSLRD